MAKNKAAVPIDTVANGYIDERWGITSTDGVMEVTIVRDGKPYTILIILHCPHADAAALNGAAAYAALPNGSIAFCGTTTLVKAVKGGSYGATNGAWA